MAMNEAQVSALRARFSGSQVKVLEKHTKTGKTLKIPYIPISAIKARLLQVDPAWSWRPIEWFEEGGRRVGVLIELTVLGVKKLGYGAPPRDIAENIDPIKTMIANAIKNAAEDFGVGLEASDDDLLDVPEVPDVPEPETLPQPAPTTEERRPPRPAPGPTRGKSGKGKNGTSRPARSDELTEQARMRYVTFICDHAGKRPCGPLFLDEIEERYGLLEEMNSDSLIRLFDLQMVSSFWDIYESLGALDADERQKIVKSVCGVDSVVELTAEEFRRYEKDLAEALI